MSLHTPLMKINGWKIQSISGPRKTLFNLLDDFLEDDRFVRLETPAPRIIPTEPLIPTSSQPRPNNNNLSSIAKAPAPDNEPSSALLKMFRKKLPKLKKVKGIDKRVILEKQVKRIGSDEVVEAQRGERKPRVNKNFQEQELERKEKSRLLEELE